MTERKTIQIDDIPVEVVRGDVKHLYLRVYAPDGRVRVSCPSQLDDEAIRQAVTERLDWIRKQQQRFATREVQSERDMASGESHYYQGKPYRLEIVEREQPPSVTIRDENTLVMNVRAGVSPTKRAAILSFWYRQRLSEQIPPLVEKWEQGLGVTVDEWHIKRMKTLWGSCNIDARRIWLNLELIKKPPACLDYVVLHEMVHLLERNHGDRFQALMDRHMPEWRAIRDELNRAPVAHKSWEY
jgi:predicted metal-dependent hydrolase